MQENEPTTAQEGYAPEFLAAIGDTAFETLRAYLEKLGVSKQAVKLLDSVVFLTHAQYITKYRELHLESVTEDLSQILPRVSCEVISLGGTFPGPEVQVMLESVLEVRGQMP